MGHEFETRQEIEVPATPEQVWEAIATGPGIDSWFMGRNQIVPGLGGTVQMAVPDAFTSEATISAWEPPARLAYASEPGPDGSTHAFEFIVEGRGRGSSVVRLVHSGFLGGNDWESEYDALRKGDPMYLRTLGTYLTHFPGRFGTPISAWAPPQPSEQHVWDRLTRALGLTGEPAEGAAVRFTLPGGEPVDGVVDSVLFPSFLGVRTPDGLYRFVGRGGFIGVGHHVFTEGLDEKQEQESWRSWLAETFA